MYTLIVAEKPSVGRDIARVVKAAQRSEGYLSGDGYRVTWAVGHLVSLANPEEIDARYKRWRAEDLPLLPEAIPLKVLPKTKKQFGTVKRLMNAGDCERIVCATDAGREGELIFRYIYRMAGCRKPVARLWISSMTDEAIRDGLANMRPGMAYDALYESARCRSEADWLVGMNASRAYSLQYDALLSIGRVQTPTLKLIVERDREIAGFVPRTYWSVHAEFNGYTGIWLDERTKEKRFYDREKAESVAGKVRGKLGVVEAVSREEKTEWPPFLYDLTQLQRDANRLLSFTAKKTLDTAQKLYESRKLITYPRTDSQRLTRDMAAQARNALASLPGAYDALIAPLLGAERLPTPRRVFDDEKVTDHHAIIPTGKKADLDKLPADERALFDLVIRRFLAAFYPEHRYAAVRILTRAQGEPFESLGRETLREGWKAVYPEKEQGERPLPSVRPGETRPVTNVQVKRDVTKPPVPHTDASLLQAMEHAGREIEDEALRESMKRSGLGTPATRAAVIERLLAVGYARRNGRGIRATEKGFRLIAVVPDEIASPETTGRWEKALSDIAAGELAPDRFLSGIRGLSEALVKSSAAAPADVVFEREKRGCTKSGKTRPKPAAGCPLCGKGGVLENSKAFYCSRWRDGCKLTIWKDCCERMGGPKLTASLLERVFREGHVRGSTGVLVHKNGSILFEPVL